MTNESEVVSRFLSTKNIHLPSSNDWLDGCIEWFKSQQENYSTSELQKFALQQWLLADLRMISHGSLPPNLSDINSIMLTGTYPMQINYFFNVGESAYSQYEKMRKLCLDDQQIGAETQASWMPKPKRMLKMEITDGVQTIQGFEYSYLTKLNESMEPGLKVVVKGPVECRKGVLLLKDNNIEILGGELDTLVESNPVAHIIAEKLQFDPNVVKNNIAQTDNTTQLFSQVNVGNENRAPNNKTKPLSWAQRLRIAIGTETGLQFLHTVLEERPLIHGDIKSANILLDKDFEPKIGDFGLTQKGPTLDHTHLNVETLCGTLPYLPHEFLRRKILTVKLDTFSFGVVLFEIATDKRAYDRERKNLYDEVLKCEDNNLHQLIDPKADMTSGDVAVDLMQLGKHCVQSNYWQRPDMESVLDNLNSIAVDNIRLSTPPTVNFHKEQHYSISNRREDKHGTQQGSSNAHIPLITLLGMKKQSE